MNFRVQQIPRVRQLHWIGEVGKWNYLSMTYSLSNNCTKNYYNRTLTVQVIVEDVVTRIFLRHSVVQLCFTRKTGVIWCPSPCFFYFFFRFKNDLVHFLAFWRRQMFHAASPVLIKATKSLCSLGISGSAFCFDLSPAACLGTYSAKYTIKGKIP